MSRVDGRVDRGQKVQLKNLLSAKNKVFGAAENRQKNNFNFKIFIVIFLSLAMSSKLDINNFGNFNVSSLLDTGIWHHAHAATSTTTTMKLKDLPIGGVINLGAYNYVKIADNQFMQTEVAACPDGKTVAGKYVKCFDDNNAYAQTCTGSYYCNTSNTAWNSSTGKCDSSVTCPAGSSYCGTNSEWSSSAGKCVPKSSVCTGSSIWSGASLSCSAPAGSTYCGDNSSWDSTTSKCVGTAGSSSCGSGTIWDSDSSKCVVLTAMQNWTGCSKLTTNATVDLYDTAGQKVYTVKKFADGNCYTYDDVSEGATWSDAKTLCSNISGWSLPTRAQFDSLISAVGAANMDSVWCGDQCSPQRHWHSASTEYDGGFMSYYKLSVDALRGSVDSDGMRSGSVNSNIYHVRCVVN